MRTNTDILTDDFYTIQEIADKLKVSRDTVERRIKLHHINVLRDGRKLVRIPRDEARKLIDMQKRFGNCG